jgi:flagellar protein FliO/FliZ
MGDFVQQFVLMLVVLAGVLALAWATLRLLQGRLKAGWGSRAAARPDDDALRFVRALPVGPRERVVLMDHRGERWMLGVTAGGISLLARWPAGSAAPPEAAAFGSAPAAADPD